MSSTAPPLNLAEYFGLIVDGVRRTAAAKLVCNWALTPLVMLLYARLGRMMARFARLAAHVEAGTLPQPRPRRPAPTTVARARAPSPWPGGYAWLVRLVQETAVYGSQLQHLLSQPEMQALLKAAPQIGRIVRPLCRMLAVPPSVTPKPPFRPRPARRSGEHPAGSGAAIPSVPSPSNPPRISRSG